MNGVIRRLFTPLAVVFAVVALYAGFLGFLVNGRKLCLQTDV